MQITNAKIISHMEMTVEEIMQSIEGLDGDFLVAYSLNADGSCADNALILETDVYNETDDEFLFFKGQKFNWEVDLYSLQRVKEFTFEHLKTASVDQLVNAAKYYLVNRAYPPNL